MVLIFSMYVVGITVARPKTLRAVADDRSNGFPNWESWLPIQAMHNPGAGVIGNAMTNDMFEYGHQFVNWDAAATTYKAGNIQWADMSGTVGTSGVYPVESSINSVIWKTSTVNNVRQDGKVQLNILTDLPKDWNTGATAVQEPTVSDAQSVGDLANEYLAKLREIKAGKKTQLPNVRAKLEELAISSGGPGSGLRTS